jgi:hypothetical protein
MITLALVTFEVKGVLDFVKYGVTKADAAGAAHKTLAATRRNAVDTRFIAIVPLLDDL